MKIIKKNIKIVTKYINEYVDIEESQYTNNRKAISLVDTNTGEPVAVATVNLPELQPETPNHVFLKGWSENEGLPEALADNNIVRLTGHITPTGFVEAQEAILIED